MKKIGIAVLALACTGVLLAKGPAAPAKAAEDVEEAGVMIDSRADMDDAGSGDEDGVYAEPAVPGGLPSSYGQCKGIMTDAGRSVLVFESSEDGTLSFVKVSLGGPAASWKLLGRIPRSAD